MENWWQQIGYQQATSQMAAATPEIELQSYFETLFYQMPDLHQISLGGRALISDYLILGMSAKILSSVNLPKSFDHAPGLL